MRERGRETSPVRTIRVAVANRQRGLLVDRRRIRRAVEAVLRDAGIEDAEISVAVVGDKTIARLHDEFLGDPTPTDVLSFVFERLESRLEGEVVVSADTAQAVAPRFAATAEDELLRYVVHGTLHLVGYDDATPSGRAAMRKQERRYLGLGS
jgi:probable rRNA maturation factor